MVTYDFLYCKDMMVKFENFLYSAPIYWGQITLFVVHCTDVMGINETFVGTCTDMIAINYN